MISFLQYLEESKRGRKSLSKTRDADADFIRKEFNYNDTPNMTNTIRMLRKSKVIKQCNKLSFKKNDANWLKTKLKNIAITT